MADLEKKLFELLHELPQKRDDFEELQQRYNTELLNKRELVAEMENLKMEGNNIRTQLEFTNKALHKCEENYTNSREIVIKHKLSLDVASKTMDAIKEQSNKLHVENVQLKKKVEELERDIKTESFLRESCTAKQIQTQTTIESLIKQVHNLEKDFRCVERKLDMEISIGNKRKLLVEHKDATIANLKTKIEELSEKLVSLTSENQTLQENLKERKPAEQHYAKEILQEWETSVKEMKTRAENYEKETETLHQTIQNALNAQSRFQKLEAAANDRVRELELKLKAASRAEKKKHIDRYIQTDLDISIDVACETTRLELENASTQTHSDSPIEKPSITGTTAEGSLHQSTPKYSYPSILSSNSVFHSGTLSTIISNFQRNQHLSQSQSETDEMPAQANPNISSN